LAEQFRHAVISGPADVSGLSSTTLRWPKAPRSTVLTPIMHRGSAAPEHILAPFAGLLERSYRLSQNTDMWSDPPIVEDCLLIDAYNKTP